MVNVLFFAKLREDLDCSAIELKIAAPIMTRKALVACIADNVTQRHGEELGAIFLHKLSEENLVLAVNHQVCKSDITINDADEVAFYPPVTGG
ncbi:MAG: MoaD/ThiS family protein [Pseudomonadales bacterium]|nr:MoaD/ThiS family protein [Pseudomonadales bacterium]